jgi:electron transport protein HydN
MVACPFGAMQVAVVAEHAQALKCDLCAHRADGQPALLLARHTR